jgi:tRNA pseudouridine38-40 synthase
MRYFMHLAYRGENFHGWQTQPNASSVQQTIEEAISTIVRYPTAIVGAGRTDAGVNARMMIAHLDLPDDFKVDKDNGKFLRGLNTLVGRDIAIYSLRPVAADAHARFDATARSYRYFAHRGKNPFVGRQSWQAPDSLDFDRMNAAAALLPGRRDFTSFSKLHTDVKTNICNLRAAKWIADGEGRWYFEITADRFLRNMVRAIVGTLVEVGRGRLAPEEMNDIIERRDRSAAGTSMPGEALFLWDIQYPYISF